MIRVRLHFLPVPMVAFLLVVVAIAVLALAPVFSWSVFGAASAAPQASHNDPRPPSIQVLPSVVIMPESRTRKGIWILGSGFRPGEEVGLRIIFGGTESDIGLLTTIRGGPTQGPVANEDGAFATGFEIRPRYDKLLDTAMTLRAQELDSGEVVATAPLFICHPNAEEPEPWCPIAQEMLPLK